MRESLLSTSGEDFKLMEQPRGPHTPKVRVQHSDPNQKSDAQITKESGYLLSRREGFEAEALITDNLIKI